MRGLIEEVLIGPVGLIAAATAKRRGIHVIDIKFNNGKRSVIEVNDKIYKPLLVSCF